MFGPPVPPFGPTPNRIVLLGEAPGERESELLRPFVGPSGRELQRMLQTVGLQQDNLYATNVFSRQPDGNNTALYGVGVSDSSPQFRHLGPLTANPITYLSPEHEPELDRLYADLSACSPNIIIALGNTATWALGLGTGISSLRGTVHLWTNPLTGRATKVLPTYHPAAVLREWSLRVVAIADLEKASVEAASPLLRFDNSELWLAPTLDDLVEFDALHIQPSTTLATDVETKRGQITCVSFAPSVDVSLCVPFWQEGPDPNYWASEADEFAAWGWVRKWLEDPRTVKVGQNFLYDLQYFIVHGIRPRNCTADTMLMHHSLYSELQKGLGFLGSVYANTPSWKHMRTFKKEEQLKKDD